MAANLQETDRGAGGVAGLGEEEMTDFWMYGPFKIPEDNGWIPNDLDSFWNGVESDQEGLSTAIGVYVFLMRSGGGYSPWYVGQTQSGFIGECFGAYQKDGYNFAMTRYDKGNPYLILIPKLTDSGKFSHSGGDDIDFVENYCIGLAIKANPGIVNKKNTMHHKSIVLPGIMNGPQGHPGTAASVLRQAFRL